MTENTFAENKRRATRYKGENKVDERGRPRSSLQSGGLGTKRPGRRPGAERNSTHPISPVRQLKQRCKNKIQNKIQNKIRAAQPERPIGKLPLDRRKRIGRARERGAGKATVLLHAADQVVDAGEFHLRPDPVD